MATATNGGPFYHRKCCYVALLSGLLLSTCGVLVQDSLLSFSLNESGKISSFVPVYAYVFLLNPLTFYLNMLLFILHVTGHAGASVTVPFPVFLTNHLPGAAQIVSFLTLLFGLPLWIHAAVSEESIGLAIGAVLICIAMVSVLSYVCKKLMFTCCHADRAFVPALFSLCISTGFVIFFDPFLSFSNTNQNNTLIHTTLHFLLLIVIFVVFKLGITLLILYISVPPAGQQAAIQAKYMVTTALSVAFSTLLVGVYMKAFMADTDMHGKSWRSTSEK